MSSATAFQPPSTAKRHRTSSQSSGSSVSSREYVASKATRISPPAESDEGTPSTTNPGGRPLLCTLPPTCNHKPTPLSNTRELESHYATYHAHVCEQPGCGSVFPDARLLELHQTENHDPLAAMRKDRGEKIFACHLSSCSRTFSSPKNRRLHLISAHGYPKEYFFAVTNKGVGGLLKKWGEGASMVRGKWTPREPSEGKGSNPQIKVDKETIRGSSSQMDVDDDDDSDDDIDSEGSDDDDAPPSAENQAQVPQPPRQSFYSTLPKPDNARMSIDQDPEATPRPYASARSLPPDPADALASGMSTLSLIPPSVRFGRGRGGGFATASGRPAHQPKQPSQSQTPAKADTQMAEAPTGADIPITGASEDNSGASAGSGAKAGNRGRGRGGRGYISGEGGRGGRGRGRGRGRGG